ncbi:S26 family signal peptidase [Candidatus Nomurabacteria bacterium]|nr:S26 family signal peptidase [Candidatus Nomurabacteria bacterium]
MIPAIKPGDIIVALPMLKIRQGDIVLASQNGREVIKRVARLSSDSVFLVGDNLNESSDGRKYGETKLADVIGRVLLR